MPGYHIISESRCRTSLKSWDDIKDEMLGVRILRSESTRYLDSSHLENSVFERTAFVSAPFLNQPALLQSITRKLGWERPKGEGHRIRIKVARAKCQ